MTHVIETMRFPSINGMADTNARAASARILGILRAFFTVLKAGQQPLVLMASTLAATSVSASRP